MTKYTLVAFLLLATFAAVPAKAAIVITGASTIVETSAATDATATFELTVKGYSTAPLSETVGFFGFDVVLPGAVTITNRDFVSPLVGPGWVFFQDPIGAFGAKLIKTDIGQTTRFAGGPDGTSLVANVPFGTAFPSSATPSELAVIKFSVARAAIEQTFDVNFAAADAIFLGGGSGQGFFQDATPTGGTAGDTVTPLSVDFGAKGFTVGALSAVPEPSSALLCGMGLLGLVGYRRRRAA